MADSKRMAERFGARQVSLFIVLAGLVGVWIVSVFSSGGDVKSQTFAALPRQPVSPQSLQKASTQKRVMTTTVATTVAVAPRPIAFHFTIAPNTPLKDLLPLPPHAMLAQSPRLIDDISQVPEVAFQEPLAKSPDALRQTAHTIAKINHLNHKKSDGFVDALLRARPDLAGLPMAMGDTCRTKGDRAKFFTDALNLIKQAKRQGGSMKVPVQRFVTTSAGQPLDSTFNPTGQAPVQRSVTNTIRPTAPVPAPTSAPGARNSVAVHFDGVVGEVVQQFVTVANLQSNTDPDVFWSAFANACVQADKANVKLDPSQLDLVIVERIAALMQVVAPESVAMRKGLVKYLAGTSHVEATRALAKLAMFAPEDEVRRPAIEALKVRRDRDYTEVLLRGLHYPLPAVAKHAAEAITKLERTDLVPQLVSFLEEPDPRAPIMKDMGDERVPVVRELVRINHHRNCLMCHAPAVSGEVPSTVTTAEVPRPDQPLPSPSDGYNNSIPDVLVRLDVTYLRQDFSMLEPVADANPWPAMQRFDFLVRTRKLSDQEANAFPKAKAGMLSPYQRCTLAALRELTGKDAAPTPAAWRKVLDLPARRAVTEKS